MKLDFRCQDYENSDLKWQLTEKKIGRQDCSLSSAVNSLRAKQSIPQPVEDEKSAPQQLMLKIIADDESREASIRRRVRKLENNLFDEYGDELCAFRASVLNAN